MKAKFQIQASKTKKTKAHTKSTAHKMAQTLMKPLSGLSSKSRQPSNIHQVVPQSKTAAYTLMLSQNGFDDVTSNGSIKRTTSKTKD